MVLNNEKRKQILSQRIRRQLMEFVAIGVGSFLIFKKQPSTVETRIKEPKSNEPGG